jgi:hypothetical protein
MTGEAAPRLAGIVVAEGLLTGAVSAVLSPVMTASTSSRRSARGSAWNPPMSPSGSGGFPDPDGGAGRRQAGRMLALRWNRLPGSYCALILASRSYLAGP